MPMIGVRELREQTAQVLRHIEEEKEEYVITNQGRPVAVLLTIDSDQFEAAIRQAARHSAKSAHEIYLQLAESIRQSWPAGLGMQALMDEIRGSD